MISLFRRKLQVEEYDEVHRSFFLFILYLLIYVFIYKGVLDITTTEVADYVVGGVMACGSSRFGAIIEKKIPFVLSVGALDMVNFGAKDTVPGIFQQRKIYEHNEQVFSSCLASYWAQSTHKNCQSKP